MNDSVGLLLKDYLKFMPCQFKKGEIKLCKTAFLKCVNCMKTASELSFEISCSSPATNIFQQTLVAAYR